MRPELTTTIKLNDFQDFYWLKEELQAFCRNNQISATGSKQEITHRIEVFLQTGEIIKPMKGARRKETSKGKVKQVPLTLDTVITEHHRCSQDVRAFFKTAISPKFHFSTYIQDFFKNNIGKTYRDAVTAWYEEEERKKDPNYKKKIAPQFEYNQFIQDFFADPNNKTKSRNEAINAWNKIKQLPGSNQYKP